MTGEDLDVHASGINIALEAAWANIRAEHPDVPQAVVILATNAGSLNNEITVGHWAEARWSIPDHGRRGEVTIAGEILNKPAAMILEVLLHEAAHGIATTRKIDDTSRDHRYHNKRYKKLAEEVGLDVGKHETLGWQNTSLRPETAARFATAIASIERAQSEARGAHRLLPVRAPSGVGRGPRPAPGPGGEADPYDPEDVELVELDERTGGKKVTLVCGCGDVRIQMAAGVWRTKKPPLFHDSPECGTRFELA